MDADTLKLRADTQLRVLATRNKRTKLSQLNGFYRGLCSSVWTLLVFDCNSECV